MVIVAAGTLVAQSQQHTSVSSDGWTLTADDATSVLSISHDKLGPVMKQVRLNLQDGHGLHALAGWSVESDGQRRLMLRTTEPRTAWSFELGTNLLKISSTSTSAVVTAELPATADRLPVRILDPRGAPVDWVGTDEVAQGYGGSETRNQSFLAQPESGGDVLRPRASLGRELSQLIRPQDRHGNRRSAIRRCCDVIQRITTCWI